jgi:hypothetical protein
MAQPFFAVFWIQTGIFAVASEKPWCKRLFAGELLRAIRRERLQGTKTDAVAFGHPVQIALGLHLVPFVGIGHKRVGVLQGESIRPERLSLGDF